MNAVGEGSGSAGELDFLLKALERLEEGFQLEKDQALSAGLKEAEAFRDRCRAHYQVRVSEIAARARQIRYSASRAGILTAEMEEQAGIIETAASEASARFSGTPNRLVRNMKSAEKEEE
jgi:hypothetical protein